MPASKQIELRYPAAGVAYRLGYRDSINAKGPYPTPWSVNCRYLDPIANRLRGGSRPGLEKYLENNFGTPLTDIISVDAASGAGAGTTLAVVANSTLGVVTDGVLSTVTGGLATDAGVLLCTDAGVQILVNTGTVPATGFLTSRGNKVYVIGSAGVTALDVVTGQVNALAATAGTLPTGNTLGCVYRDRLVLAGSDNSIYMSRQGDFTDWDFGVDVEDSGRALAFQLSEAGKIGGLVTALVESQDASLLAATADSLWIVQGDPAAGGSLRNASPHVGIVGSRAFTRVEDSVAFLGNDGLYIVQASGGGLTNLSRDKLPEELTGIGGGGTTVFMGYNHQERGIHLFLVPGPEAGEHWFFDLDMKGFWPVVYSADHQPGALCVHEGELLLAGTDGYVRTIGGYDDDGAAVESHVLIGPVQMAANATYGRLVNFHGALGDESGDVTWRIVTGDTAEDAVERAKLAVLLYQAGNTAGYTAYVAASGTLSEGRGHMRYPRVRSVWMVVWLQSVSQWAYEGITLETTQSGRWR